MLIGFRTVLHWDLVLYQQEGKMYELDKDRATSPWMSCSTMSQDIQHKNMNTPDRYCQPNANSRKYTPNSWQNGTSLCIISAIMTLTFKNAPQEISFPTKWSLNNIKVSFNPCVKMLMADSENVVTVTWTVPVQGQWIKFKKTWLLAPHTSGWNGTGKWLI